MRLSRRIANTPIPCQLAWANDPVKHTSYQRLYDAGAVTGQIVQKPRMVSGWSYKADVAAVAFYEFTA
jgi:hypothetical protein